MLFAEIRMGSPLQIYDTNGNQYHDQGNILTISQVAVVQWAVTPQTLVSPKFPCFITSLFFDAFRNYSLDFFSVWLLLPEIFTGSRFMA